MDCQDKPLRFKVELASGECVGICIVDKMEMGQIKESWMVDLNRMSIVDNYFKEIF
jgi:hypothetical protein